MKMPKEPRKFSYETKVLSVIPRIQDVRILRLYKSLFTPVNLQLPIAPISSIHTAFLLYFFELRPQFESKLFVIILLNSCNNANNFN